MSADAADTHAEKTPQLTLERIDGLISQLERAAEQLRSGELSADAAATMVEDCAALATEASGELERLARAGQSSISPRAPDGVSIGDWPAQQIPGQDSLL
jgi:hypothetical protein